jgi:hypothetical protein
MCSYFRMEIISELEEEFSARRQARGSTPLRVFTLSQAYTLDEAKFGLDFILGRSGNRIYCLPISSVLELSGMGTQEHIDSSLAEHLCAQRQPVKLSFSSPQGQQASWLLNVVSPWLRVAGQQGVVWVPISRLAFAEIEMAFSEASA